MAFPNTQWQDYLINRAYDLVTATCADGFFLDSLGARMNYPVVTLSNNPNYTYANPSYASENVAYTSQQWSAATLRFIDRFRAKIRTAQCGKPPAAKADAVVMGEITTGQFPFHWDGRSAGDLSAWNGEFQQDCGLLLGAPIRYASPNVNLFVDGSGIYSTSPSPPCNSSSNTTKFNGTALSSVNQVFAAGYIWRWGRFPSRRHQGWDRDQNDIRDSNEHRDSSSAK